MTNPANETVQFQYKPAVAADPHTGGLLSQLIDPRNGVHAFEYDNDGFLTKDTPPDGAFQSLSRGGFLDARQVTHQTALGRTTSYAVAWDSINSTETSSVTDPAGLKSTTTTNADHSLSITSPDGTQATTATAPDPRFGMDAFSVSWTTKAPSGLTRTSSETRTATMMSPADPLTLRTLLTQVSVNGRISSSTYDGVAKTITQTTPAGRQTVLSLDSLGRVVQIAAPGVQAMVLHYDSRGRNDTITQGTRVTSLAYDAAGFLHSVLDPAQHTTLFGYDLAGRPTSETLPNQSVIGMGYDADGNVTSVTPPGRLAHSFAFLGRLGERLHSTRRRPATNDAHRLQPGPPGPQRFPTRHGFHHADLRQREGPPRDAGDEPRHQHLRVQPGHRSANQHQHLGRHRTDFGYDGSLLTDTTWSGPFSGNVHKT